VGAKRVICIEVDGEVSGAMATGAEGMGVGPFAAEGLDEAFCLAVGLGAVGAGEVVFDAELKAGGGEGLRVYVEPLSGRIASTRTRWRAKKRTMRSRARTVLGIFSSRSMQAKATREWSSMATCSDSCPAPSVRMA
jgi:hypothetical protein